jgi:polygalacturonase
MSTLFEMPRQRFLLPVAALAAMWSGLAIGQTSFDVTDYGARADDVTDSAGAIQKAIDAAAESGGGIIRFPKSSKAYLVGRTLKISSSNIELSGHGATIKLADGAANDTRKKPFLNTAGQVHVIYVSGTEAERIRNVRMTGLTIDGNIYNQAGYYNPRGIVFEHTEHVLLEDVKIIRPFVGLDFGINCDDCEARNCVIENYSEDGFDASGDANHTSGGVTTNIRFVNCHARNAPDSGGNAWEIEDGAQHVLVQDCSVENVGGNGFGIRNHWTKGAVARSRDIELRRVRIKNVAGKYGIYSHSPIPDHFPDNSMADVRLVDVTCDAPVLFYGPLKGLRIDGGSYKTMYLGWAYGSKSSREPGGPFELADVHIRNATVQHVRINGGREAIELKNVLVDATAADQMSGVRIVGGSDNVVLQGCTITGAGHAGIALEAGASPVILNSIVWGNKRAFGGKGGPSRVVDQFDDYQASERWKGGGGWTTNSANAACNAIGSQYASGRYGARAQRIRSSSEKQGARSWLGTEIDKERNVVRMIVRPAQSDRIVSASVRETPTGAYASIVRFGNDGKLSASFGEQMVVLGPYAAGKWHEIIMQFDFVKNRWRVRIDKQAWTAWGIFFDGSTFSRASAVRFDSHEGGTLDIDFVEVAPAQEEPGVPGRPQITHSCIEGGIPDGAVGRGKNISLAPMFCSGPKGRYYLSQKSAGLKAQSPCVDAGKGQAADAGMNRFTTRSDSEPDTGIVDMGYHHPIAPTN